MFNKLILLLIITTANCRIIKNDVSETNSKISCMCQNFNHEDGCQSKETFPIRSIKKKGIIHRPFLNEERYELEQNGGKLENEYNESEQDLNKSRSLDEFTTNIDSSIHASEEKSISIQPDQVRDNSSSIEPEKETINNSNYYNNNSENAEFEGSNTVSVPDQVYENSSYIGNINKTMENSTDFNINNDTDSEYNEFDGPGGNAVPDQTHFSSTSSEQVNETFENSNDYNSYSDSTEYEGSGTIYVPDQVVDVLDNTNAESDHEISEACIEECSDSSPYGNPDEKSGMSNSTEHYFDISGTRDVPDQIAELPEIVKNIPQLREKQNSIEHSNKLEPDQEPSEEHDKKSTNEIDSSSFKESGSMESYDNNEEPDQDIEGPDQDYVNRNGEGENHNSGNENDINNSRGSDQYPGKPDQDFTKNLTSLVDYQNIFKFLHEQFNHFNNTKVIQIRIDSDQLKNGTYNNKVVLNQTSIDKVHVGQFYKVPDNGTYNNTVTKQSLNIFILSNLWSIKNNS